MGRHRVGGEDDQEFASSVGDTPEQLYALWDGAFTRSRARLDAFLARGGPDQLVHMAAAELPLEGRLMQESLVYRDDGGTEGDYDVTGMLQRLRFEDYGSMAFADLGVPMRSSTMTVMAPLLAGRSSA
jgi:hypothetical protein